MTGCACDRESKVIPFPERRIKKGEGSYSVDKAAADYLQRIMNASSNEDEGEMSVFDHDIRAIENEEEFRRRFGFALGRRGRMKLFEVIDRYDLTDGEVSLLGRADCIRWDGNNMKIEASKILLFSRWAFFAGLALFTALAGLVFVYEAQLPKTGQTILLFLAGSLMAGLIIHYQRYLAPHYRHKRRVGKQAALPED